MSGLHAATERSLLLRQDHGASEDSHIDESAATSPKAQSGVEAVPDGSGQHKVNDADVERQELSSEADDQEALAIAKTIKFVLPVLAVGVRLQISK